MIDRDGLFLLFIIQLIFVEGNNVCVTTQNPDLIFGIPFRIVYQSSVFYYFYSYLSFLVILQAEEGEDDEEIDELFKIGKNKNKTEKSVVEILLERNG